MGRKKIILTIILILIIPSISANNNSIDVKDVTLPTVKINLNEETTIYEGDIINCTITGETTNKYWYIDNQSKHTTFYGNDPIIFDPEPTPLDANFVNLTVYAENEYGNASDTVQVIVKRIYFGDIHWHSILSDGKYPLNTEYINAKKDNYLDFACSTEHTELWPMPRATKFLHIFAWVKTKNLVREHYLPGNFTTLLAFEYTGSKINLGNILFPLTGDTSHINFYYKDLYSDASRYSNKIKTTYDTLLSAMSKEWDEGHYNIGFFHHPLAGDMKRSKLLSAEKYSIHFYVNWTNLVDSMKDDDFRNNVLKIMRGVEAYSRWGTAIGKYSEIPVNWTYYQNVMHDHPDCWVENGMWEWSESTYTRGYPFVMQASSDSHVANSPGSAEVSLEKFWNSMNPSGIIGAFSVHNTRDEIWDAMNNCDIYGSQLLKIRANIRLDGQMALGKWINCSSPLNITITAQSTFPGIDSSGRNMKPYDYLDDQLDYPIQDIWLVKKDRDKGRPWCKVINHISPDANTVVVNFEDYDVQPNDFYYVAIRQKGQELGDRGDEYMAFIGPIFIDNVV